MQEKKSSSTEIFIHRVGHQKDVTIVKEINGLIFTGDKNGKISIWNSDLSKEIGWIHAHQSAVTDIEWIPDKEIIITSSQGINLKMWSWGEFDLLNTIKAHGSAIIQIYRKKDTLITAGRDYILKEWLIETNSLKLIKRRKIPRLEEIFPMDDLLVISCTDGSLLVYEAKNFQFKKNLKMKQSKIISSIKKARKHIEQFYKKDPYGLFMVMRRENGIPATAYTQTEQYFILGHLFGLITIWRKKDLENKKAFFVHGTNVTAMDYIDKNILTLAFDSKLGISKIEKEKTQYHKLVNIPLTFTKTPSNEFIIGHIEGKISVLNQDFTEKRIINSIPSLTAYCISPKNVLCGTEKGTLLIYSTKSLELIDEIKIHQRRILGIFYFNNSILSIDERGELKELNEQFNEIKTYIVSEYKKLEPKGFGRYVSLTQNLLYDFKNNKLIKGEVSSATQKEYQIKSIYEIKQEQGNLIIFINQKKLDKLIKQKDYTFYSKEMLSAFSDLCLNVKKMQFKRTSQYAVIQKESGIFSKK